LKGTVEETIAEFHAAQDRRCSVRVDGAAHEAFT
jgi:hypothetical protein